MKTDLLAFAEILKASTADADLLMQQMIAIIERGDPTGDGLVVLSKLLRAAIKEHDADMQRQLKEKRRAQTAKATATRQANSEAKFAPIKQDMINILSRAPELTPHGAAKVVERTAPVSANWITKKRRKSDDRT
ncbi:MAG: hypothetical protein ACLQFW_24160 [Xanthobacteraceae bacterium]